MSKLKGGSSAIIRAGKVLRHPQTASKAAIKRMAGRILNEASVSNRSRTVIEGTATKYARALRRLADK